MPSNDTTEMLGQLSEASYQMAVGFKRAAETPADRREAARQALSVLRELRHAVLVVGAMEGEVWTFHPADDDVCVCENCGKSLSAHVVEDYKCP